MPTINNQESPNYNENDDNDYIDEINYEEYLKLDSIDKYEIYDIAFENLSFNDQLSKIKEHMLANTSLLPGINIDHKLNKKYQ